MNYNPIEDYKNYIKKVYDRYEVILEIHNKFSIKKALYPGSYIHITPSLIIQEITYVDSFKKTKKFFDNVDIIMKFINANKIYEVDSKINFILQDFNSDLELPRNYYDLLISQFSGFISQSCKKYLKNGGILLANDSHGDATLAKLDNEYKFIGIIDNKGGKYKFSKKNLDDYFKFKHNRPIDVNKIKREMKGPKYKLKSDYYIFRKI